MPPEGSDLIFDHRHSADERMLASQMLMRCPVQFGAESDDVTTSAKRLKLGVSAWGGSTLRESVPCHPHFRIWKSC